ncbi:MAG: NAD(P)-dependent methylenetetrahydromethanopterin dehydrogenase [Pirellulaceae bacterium]|nr:NAD(P)-dependent methylenetetrahydromethanopterin dehydrogenase [Pirellulaceae bacterium]
MTHPRILIQFDSDSHASVFDSVVAVDSGVDHLLQYANIEPTNVRPLVHGAMFTRGPKELQNTAIFIGGSNAALGDSIGEQVKQTFFGPVRVSVMVDGNGANTTAAAAVLCAARHVDLSATTAIVLGGTGPVGMRVARLLLRQGSKVILTSRDAVRAEAACESLRKRLGSPAEGKLTAVGLTDSNELRKALANSAIIFSCGAAGATLLDADHLALAEQAKVAIDLNAVPPAGIEGIGVMDKAVQRGNRFDYGAIGVGGLKMKIHRESIQSLFTRNDLYLDAEEIYAVGEQIEKARSL